MTLNELKAAYEDKLGVFGMKLDVMEDDFPEPYLSSRCEYPVEIVCNPKARFMPYRSRRLFCWDLDRPYSEKHGFSENSLFLYLNDNDKIREWMEDGFRDANGRMPRHPDCLPALSALNDFVKAFKLIRDGELVEAQEIIRAVFRDKIKISDNDIFHDLNVWFSSMLGTSRGDLRFKKAGLGENPFLPIEDDFPGSGKLRELFHICDVCDISERRQDFLYILKDVIREMDSFIKIHKHNFGGEFLSVLAIRKNFELKFGGSHAVASSGISLEGKKAKEISDLFNADAVVFLHARDMTNISSPQDLLSNIINNELSYQNGEVFGYGFVDMDNNPVGNRTWGFYGNDFEKNGMSASIAAEVACLANQGLKGSLCSDMRQDC